jgi:hypothetical protein
MQIFKMRLFIPKKVEGRVWIVFPSKLHGVQDYRRILYLSRYFQQLQCFSSYKGILHIFVSRTVMFIFRIMVGTSMFNCISFSYFGFGRNSRTGNGRGGTTFFASLRAIFLVELNIAWLAEMRFVFMKYVEER